MVERRDGAPASVAWSALGSEVLLAVTDESVLPEARAVVEDELAAIDRACSRFREDSALQRINAGAGHAVRVDPLCAEAVEVALRAVRLTGGAVDPALGRELILAGYDRDFALLDEEIDPAQDGGSATEAEAAGRAERQLVRVRRLAGWRTIEVDREASTVRIGRGVLLDLGATAKALAADRAAERVRAATGSGTLVNLGGDIAVAGRSPAGGWLVFVTADHRSGLDAPGQMVTIAQGGLATSSTRVRRWTQAGRAMHHIIDPETGAPAQEVWSTVSVAASSCVDANIAVTAALVLGASAVAWLEESGLPARLVAADGSVHRVGDWPATSEPAPVGAS